MKNYNSILAKADLFNHLDDNLEDIITCLKATLRSYGTGEILIQTGDSVSHIGVIVEGNALITKEDIDGNRIIISGLAIGDMFGEAISGAGIKESPVTVITATGCRVVYIHIQRIISTCGMACPHHTQIIKNLLRNICLKNMELNNHINILTKKTLREKLQTFLRQESQKNGSNQFAIGFTREELADYMFANRSALSRELSLMKKEGLIDYKKNKFILRSF